MHFNAKKCFVMRITHKRNPMTRDYILGQSTLEVTDCHSYLGVELSNNLSWNKHVNKITSSANRSLGFIRRNLFSCPQHIKTNAYLTLVRPLLEYSSSVWDPYTHVLINKIEQVQHRAARFIVNDYSRHSSITGFSPISI